MGRGLVCDMTGRNLGAWDLAFLPIYLQDTNSGYATDGQPKYCPESQRSHNRSTLCVFTSGRGNVKIGLIRVLKRACSFR